MDTKKTIYLTQDRKPIKEVLNDIVGHNIGEQIYLDRTEYSVKGSHENTSRFTEQGDATITKTYYLDEL